MAVEIHAHMQETLNAKLGPGEVEAAQLLTVRALLGDVEANERLKLMLDRAGLLPHKRTGLGKILDFVRGMPPQEVPDFDQYFTAIQELSLKRQGLLEQPKEETRTVSPETPPLQTTVSLNMGLGIIQVDGKTMKLAPQQMIIVQQLLSKPATPSTIGEIALKIFGKNEHNFRKRSSTIVAQLRESMGDTAKNPKYIVNSKEGGYQFTRHPKLVTVVTEAGPNEFTNLKDIAARWDLPPKLLNELIKKLPDKSKQVTSKGWPKQTYLVPAGVLALERQIRAESDKTYKNWKDVPALVDGEQAFLAHHLQEILQNKQEDISKKFSIILDETAVLQIIDACGEGISRRKDSPTPPYGDAIKLTHKRVLAKLEGLAIDPKKALAKFGDSKKNRDLFSPITKEILRILSNIPDLDKRKKFIAWVFETNTITFQTDTRNSFFPIDTTDENERWRRNE